MRKQRAVVALVKIEAGFVPGGDVDIQSPTMFIDSDLSLAFATQPAGLRLEPFECANAGVRAFIEPLHAGRGKQGVNDDVFPALDTGPQKLCDQGLGITIDDQARQAIGFAMNQAHRVAGRRQPRAISHRALDAGVDEPRIDALADIEAPGAHADHRARAVRAPGEEAAVAGVNAHRFAGVGLAAVNAALEDPRMAAQS